MTPPRRRSLPRIALAAALGLAAAGARPAAAQEAVLSARLTADLTGAGGAARVRVAYELSGAPPGSTLPATVLDFGPAAVEDVRVGEGEVPMALRSATGVARTGDVPVEATDRPGIGRAVVTYRVPSAVVESGGALRGRIPVLTLDRAPTAPGPGLFRATLVLPPGWEVTEGFPTGLIPDDAAGAHVVELSVVPAMVGFRARADGAWRPGMPAVLDVLAAGIVGFFVLAGWRYLRRSVP